MKRINLFLIILFVCFVTVKAFATDITIGATTQPNFNPSNIGAAVVVSNVTVTNAANSTLTCASCFRPQWVGLSGFYITVGLNNYYVKNVDSISQVTLTSACPESSPATITWHPYVEFRIYANQAFQPLGASYIVQPGTPGTGAWYKRYGASILSANGIKTLYIPEIVIDATTDAVGPTNQARYTAGFYRPDNSLIQMYACADQFRVPPVTPTSWTALCQYNSPPAIVPPANEAYTKTQIDARLISCTMNQLIYFAATGNQPTCLNVGVGLTIAAGSILTIGGVQQAINIVTDYGCNPADSGGSGDQNCFQTAINAAAAAGGKTVYAPTGVYNVSNLSIPGGVTVTGDGRDRTIIKSVTNAPILSLVEGTGSFIFKGPTVKNLGVVGSVAAGTNQDGIYSTDDTYMFNVRVDSVDITATGGDGLYIGNTYSSWFSDIYIDAVNDFGVHYNAPGMPHNVFEKLYVGNLTANKATAYRVRGGEFTCRGCNGVNNIVPGSKWAVVGRKTGVDGDVSNLAAKFTCVDCNFESWVSRGVVSYYGSTISLRGNTIFSMDVTGTGVGKAIEFDLNQNGIDYYSERIERGVIEDSVLFTAPASSFANSEPIHANGFPPLQTTGTGAAITTGGSLSRVNTFYNSLWSDNRPLPRADGNAAKVVVTGSTTLTEPNGIRYIEANCAAACTITIPWPGWYLVGDLLTIKDIRNTAAIHNVTISVNGGGSINGSGSYIINRNGQAINLRPNNTDDWRIVGGTTVNSHQATNLLDFGCDPADNANNDSACIVAAIAAAQASDGKTLYIPAGVYNTDSITSNVNGLTIEGDGPYRSIIKARGSNYNVFNITDPGFGYGLNLRRLGVRGAGKNVGTTGHCVFIKDTNSYLSEFKFEDLSLIDCRQDALNVPYIFSGIIERVTTDEVGEDHIDIGALGGSNTVTLLNNYVKTVEAWRVGYRIRPAGAIMMSNNGMAPDSAASAFWGMFGQKYVVKNATMTSGNTTLTNIASGGGFNPGDEVIIANGVSSGVHLRTMVTAVNAGSNTVTLLTAPTNTGATVIGTTDGASSGAIMTSGVTTLANVSNAADFEIGNGVILTNGVSNGVNLSTTVTAINANANTITLAAAPTNNGATIVAIDGTSYYRGPFLNNNIEDFGNYGIRLKENSRFGSISGNSFLTSAAAIPHIALKYDFAGAGYGDPNGSTPAGFWDASNTITLAGGTWANGLPIHSQAVPFMVAGQYPAQYYETSFGFSVDLPSFASSWDGVEQKMLLRISNFGTNVFRLGESNAVNGLVALMNASNANRLYLQAGATSATTTFTFPTAAPAGNNYLLQSSSTGTWSWSNFTGSGNVVRADAPALSLPTLASYTFATLPAVVNNAILICTNCHSSGAGGSGVCTSGGPGSLAIGVGGQWICPK